MIVNDEFRALHPERMTSARPNLAQLIDEFKAHHPEYSLAKTAWGSCTNATDEFIEYAAARGYTGELKRYTFWATEPAWIDDSFDKPNPDPNIYIVEDDTGQTLKNDAGITMCTWHCIIDAGHILIDFTARQYRDRFDFPHIIAIEERAMAAKAGL